MTLCDSPLRRAHHIYRLPRPSLPSSPLPPSPSLPHRRRISLSTEMRKKRSRFGAPVVVQPAVAATTSETSASSQPRKRSRFGVAVDPAIAAAAAASAAAAIEATKEKQRKIAARKAKLARWKAQQAAAPAAKAPAPATEDPSSSLPLAPVTARFDIDIKRRRRPQGALAQPSSSASLVGVFDAAPSVPKAAPGECFYIYLV